MTRAQGLRLAVVLALTVLFLAFALRGIELHKVYEAFLGMQLVWVVPALGAIMMTFLARVLRFRMLLADGVEIRRLVTVCGVAFLAINVVPLRLGEFVRSVMLLDDGVEWGTSLGAVVIERVLDLLGLLTMMLLVGALVQLPSELRVQGVDVLGAGQRVVAGSVALGMVGLVVLVVAGPLVTRSLERVPLIGMRVAAFSGQLRDAIVTLAAHPIRAAGAVGLTVVIWGGTIATVWVLLHAFPGLPVGWGIALAVTAVTVAGTVALPTPGFFGPFEVFCKAVLVLWAADPAVAAAFAIAWHLHQFGFHVVTGVALLVREGLSLSALVADSAGRQGAPR